MPTSAPTREEGMVAVPGGNVWCESRGEGPRTLLLLHGGPGAPSDYLIPLMGLAEEGWRVVRYDQLGSRRSDQPDDPSLWRVERFVEEVEAVRRALGLGRMHLLGQSWGAMLALEYALHHQEHLRSLVLSSGAASTAECVAGMDAWRLELPEAEREALDRHGAAGAFGHPDYKAALEMLYRRHLCRIRPLPEHLAASMNNMAMPVYETMWGPNEFTCTGNLRGWDRTDRLGDITVPTLIAVGRWDEVSPSCAETMRRGIAGSRLVLFEESSHSIHFEEPARFMAELRAFLLDAEAAERA